jgi:YggT family protein
MPRNREARRGMAAIFWLIDEILFLYFLVVIIYVILSWLDSFRVINSQNRFVYSVMDFCWRATRPTLDPIRRVLPNLGGLDISPVILILAIEFLRRFIAGTIAPIFL